MRKTNRGEMVEQDKKRQWGHKRECVKWKWRGNKEGKKGLQHQSDRQRRVRTGINDSEVKRGKTAFRTWEGARLKEQARGRRNKIRTAMKEGERERERNRGSDDRLCCILGGKERRRWQVPVSLGGKRQIRADAFKKPFQKPFQKTVVWPFSAPLVGCQWQQ